MYFFSVALHRTNRCILFINSNFSCICIFQDSVQLQSQHNLEALIWSCALGCFILRFMTLGTKINRKYRSISVLITEQINLYLQVISIQCCRPKRNGISVTSALNYIMSYGTEIGRLAQQQTAIPILLLWHKTCSLPYRIRFIV